MSRIAVAVGLLVAITPVAAQENLNPTPSPQYQLDSRLAHNPFVRVNPLKLNGVDYVLYKDPDSTQDRYYMLPFLLPNWTSFKQSLESGCNAGGAGKKIVVRIPLEFSRAGVTDEIAALASEASGHPVVPAKIFSYPYIYIGVKTGVRSNGDYPERIVAQFPSEIGTVYDRPPDAIDAVIGATCAELRYIYDARDMRAVVYAQQQEIQENIFSATYKGFESSDAFRKIFDKETAQGGIQAYSDQSSSGFGLNIGGHLGFGSSSSQGGIREEDTRTRTISGKIISSAASKFAQNLSVFKRQEFEAKGSKVEEEITKLVLSSAIHISGRLERTDSKNWKLSAGAESRALTSDQLKRIIESDNKYGLKFSENDEVSCTSGNPYCGSVEKQTDFTDDNKIHYEGSGNGMWIPTSIDLEVVSIDAVANSVEASFVDQLVKGSAVRPIEVPTIGADLGSYHSDLVEDVASAIFGKITDRIEHFSPSQPAYEKNGTYGRIECPDGKYAVGVFINNTGGGPGIVRTGGIICRTINVRG
ncbi:hypothetical protein EFQ99_33840 [Rhizobium vallis]|uniref:Uncharacterized protein n=2 Tax=Rhizobium TaxID=379 RepID=A0A2A6J2D6_9HYPH|nr:MULTISPECIES: hypothetical protein [Rhizobium]PDS27754.1 hypothetical protein CO650_30045 [Rhizobium phaseoli]PDT00181.1 hypothetical protein CO666_32045 [Rhizobium chutanense]RUM17785.1 hypothetical protein EFQ99_33840 [Rhizobium vallis]